jgi:hypothetical protein
MGRNLLPNVLSLRNASWLLKTQKTLLNRRPSGAPRGPDAGIGGRPVHCFVSMLLVGECGYEELRLHFLVEVDGRI